MDATGRESPDRRCWREMESFAELEAKLARDALPAVLPET
jgi:hypothetical protein